MNGDVNYPGPIHPVPTRRNGYRYFFYDKHHQAGPSTDAQWLTERELTREQESNVFDDADFHDLADATGNLYGMRRRDDTGRVPKLGTQHEQIATFPKAAATVAWHGYPVWPIEVHRPKDRPRPVPRDALDHMVRAGLITENERRRLQAGKHL